MSRLGLPAPENGIIEIRAFGSNMLLDVSDFGASPVLDRLEELVSDRFSSSKESIAILTKTRVMAGDMIVSEDGDPCLITAASVLLVARMLEEDAGDLSEYSDLLVEAGLDLEVAVIGRFKMVLPHFW